MDHRHESAGRPKISRVEVYWHAISYRTVILLTLTVLGVVLFVVHLIFPNAYSTGRDWLGSVFGAGRGEATSLASNKVRFVNLDGRVQVKKVDSVNWVNADYRMELDKGDLIQTGGDGMARISFPDGTSFTVKAESMVTVEENAVSDNRATHVGVHISTGAVDLSTGGWEAPGSSAKVSFENAVASLRRNSHAAVRTDPTRDEHEITVMTGGAEVRRGEETVAVEPYERLSIQAGGQLQKTQVLAPPELAEPVNFQPITAAEPRKAQVRLAWRPVAQAVAYQVRIGTTSMISNPLLERRVTGTSTIISGLDSGDYFWSVTAVDARGQASEPSDAYRFTLVAQGRGDEILLEVEGTQLHGNVVELIGRTEPGAVLMVNGQAVANIGADGRFRHYTPPMPRGSQRITITGQNRRGGFATKQVVVVIP
jgi:hypothetical protein